MPPPQAICIIPARLGSTRFPGKVLARETGKTLIEHVADAAALAQSVDRVVIATDDEQVRRAVEDFGGQCVMTSAEHLNGTSRLGEACEVLGLDDDQIIVNVQGDEPELDPATIDLTVNMLVRSGSLVATAAYPFPDHEDPSDPNLVKVVRRRDGLALYFSRTLIPCERDGGSTPGAEPLHHLGLYVYRRAFLRRYGDLLPTPLEQAENLEQLRVLEHGFDIAVAECRAPRGGGGIDTPEQYQAFVERWGEGKGSGPR